MNRIRVWRAFAWLAALVLFVELAAVPPAAAAAATVSAPNFSLSRTDVANLDGHAPARPGDTLRHSLTYVNSGGDSADGSVMTDPVPGGTT
jgi:uncharacterized repeat protein (TIGR01451 family)